MAAFQCFWTVPKAFSITTNYSSRWCLSLRNLSDTGEISTSMCMPSRIAQLLWLGPQTCGLLCHRVYFDTRASEPLQPWFRRYHEVATFPPLPGTGYNLLAHQYFRSQGDSNARNNMMPGYCFRLCCLHNLPFRESTKSLSSWGVCQNKQQHWVSGKSKHSEV